MKKLIAMFMCVCMSAMMMVNVQAKKKLVYNGVSYTIPSGWTYQKQGKKPYFYKGDNDSFPFFYFASGKKQKINPKVFTKKIIVEGMQEGMKTKVYHVKAGKIGSYKGYFMDATLKVNSEKALMRIFVFYNAKVSCLDYINMAVEPKDKGQLKIVNTIIKSAQLTNAKNTYK